MIECFNAQSKIKIYCVICQNLVNVFDGKNHFLTSGNNSKYNASVCIFAFLAKLLCGLCVKKDIHAKIAMFGFAESVKQII